MTEEEILQNAYSMPLMNPLPDEYFVLQMDGRLKSHHRRFVDALRAALLLRDEFPHHDIKVRHSKRAPIRVTLQSLLLGYTGRWIDIVLIHKVHLAVTRRTTRN